MIDLKKFLKVLFIELFVIALVILYGLRVTYVNRDNDKTEIQYVYDSVPAMTQNFEITIDEEKLYDTAAFVKKFPNIQKCFTYQGGIYEQMKNTTYLPSVKYSLLHIPFFKYQHTHSGGRCPHKQKQKNIFTLGTCSDGICQCIILHRGKPVI